MRDNSTTGLNVFQEPSSVSYQQFKTLEDNVRELESRINELSPTLGRSTDIASEKQDSNREIINNKIADSLWRNIFYTSAFTPFTVIVSSGTEENERYQDSTSTRFLSVDQPSKFRCTFYFGGTGYGAGATAYITTMHVRTGLSVPILSNGAEFVGLKIVNNQVYLCSYKNINTSEKLIDIKKTIVLDETVVLEIRFSPRERADFYINNEYVGTISENLPSNNAPLIFFPFFCSMKRSDSLDHKLNIEYFEFIQDRK